MYKKEDFEVTPPHPFYLNFVDAVAVDKDKNQLIPVQTGVVDKNGRSYSEKYPEHEIVHLNAISCNKDISLIWRNIIIQKCTLCLISELNVFSDEHEDDIFKRKFNDAFKRGQERAIESMLYILNEYVDHVNWERDDMFVGCVMEGWF